MAINEQDINKIITTLNQETGWTWTKNKEGVHCNVKLPIKDRREEAEKLFSETLKNKGLPWVKVSSTLRGVGESGQALVTASFTSNTDLLAILQKSDPLTNIAQKKNQIESNHSQIAAILIEKTGFPWMSDLNGVHCKVKLPIKERREDAEKLFSDTLKSKNLPHVETDSTLRGVGEVGKAIVTASFTSASVLQRLLDEASSAELTPSALINEENQKQTEQTHEITSEYQNKQLPRSVLINEEYQKLLEITLRYQANLSKKNTEIHSIIDNLLTELKSTNPHEEKIKNYYKILDRREVGKALNNMQIIENNKDRSSTHFILGIAAIATTLVTGILPGLLVIGVVKLLTGKTPSDLLKTSHGKMFKAKIEEVKEEYDIKDNKENLPTKDLGK